MKTDIRRVAIHKGAWIVVLVGLTALLAVACRGSGSGDGRPEVDEGPDFDVYGIDPSLLCPDAAVLSEGFVLSGAGIANAALAAQGAPNPQQRLKDYEDWGRVTGYFAQWSYQLAGALTAEELAELTEEEAEASRERVRQEALANPFLAATCTVELFETAAGAKQAFEARVQEARNPRTDTTVLSPPVSERPAPEIGSESIDIVYSYPTFNVFGINFRERNVMGSVSVVASGGSDTANYAEILANDFVRLLGERLEPAG